MQEIIVFEGKTQRIDQFLASKFSYSRSFFHHIIKRGALKVKSARATTFSVVKKSYRLNTGDSIQLDSLERFCDGGILEEAPNIPLKILLEKDDYLVIYKPKGMLSHPNSVRDVRHPSVVGSVYHYCKNTNGVLPTTANFIRAGLVHRLDKETDGTMLIAKSEKGLAHFKNLFQQKSLAVTIKEKEKVPLKKFYTATCNVLEKGELFLEKSMEELPLLIHKEVIPKVPHSIPKMGITKILEQLRSGKNVTFTIEILTGRTHQIRYHLSDAGVPIIGDYLYGEDTGEAMQLTAYKLEFLDPSGEYITCSF